MTPPCRRVAMMKNLLAPYEQRPWAQTNWILVRLWRVSLRGDPGPGPPPPTSALASWTLIVPAIWTLMASSWTLMASSWTLMASSWTLMLT